MLTESTCTYRKQLLHVLRESGITARVDMEFGNLEGIKQAVKHSWGTAFLPRYAVEEELRTGVLTGIPLAGQLEPFYIQLIYRKEQRLSPVFMEFIAHGAAAGACITHLTFSASATPGLTYTCSSEKYGFSHKHWLKPY